MTVQIGFDGVAHVLHPREGGEVWVERIASDLFQLGAQDGDASPLRFASACVSREELIAFRDVIDIALERV